MPVPHVLFEIDPAQCLEADGVIIDRHDTATGVRDFMGPFSKDDDSVLAMIGRLRSEEDPDRSAQLPIQYTVRLLFPPE